MREQTVETGSGNVFEDLGCANAEEHLSKAKLVRVISQIIKAKGLTQADAAMRLGIDQPNVSRLLRGQFRGFSADRLFWILNQLGQDVTITICPVKEDQGHTRVASSWIEAANTDFRCRDL